MRFSAFRLRHLALLAGLLMAYGWRLPSGQDNRLLWVVGMLALANLILDRLSIGRQPGGWPTLVAALISLTGWSLLVRFTGGVASPFIAGLVAEIGLTGFEVSPRRTLLITAASISVFWIASTNMHSPHELASQLIMIGVLAALGAVTAIQARRGRHSRSLLEQSLRDVRRRLETLNESADRLPPPYEEHRIRIAHGLKNSVHSFRGLVALLDTELTDSDRGRRIVGALQNLADQIENFGRLATQESPASSLRSAEESVDAAQAINPILSEARLIWPHLQFEAACAASPMWIGLSQGEFHEILLNLLLNAAESAHKGKVRVGVRRSPAGIEIIVDDDGPGPAPGMLRPGVAGHSTRGEGRGYGLFIVRRLVERVGGQLDVTGGTRGGARVHMALPPVEVA